METAFTVKDFFSVAAAGFIVLGVIPILRAGHQAKINLSVWSVITANAWLAAVGNAFADQKGASALYMVLNAIIISPVLLVNLKRGVWGELPAWHRAAAFILPIGTGCGVALGGEFATWAAVLVSLMLSAQLIESCFKRIAREHLLTWTWFLLADGGALFFGWEGANLSLRTLLLVWVAQCAAVMIIEVRNRRIDQMESKTVAS